ncbi:uncharacterized protein LOC18448051 isoform X2 [Amborella trichopoda]|uniref:uncharacterized protein LOC18448051 isoform X2 n=1 Tax=Amborella trichopoda TaxID=13333 RepID=UPI0009BE4EB4|nr:uncharacterized protein LOC18448051 isoform X2 [Amborella trichopoda]|eukprot:XP_020531558.1 uncharacterized protein LOC18448051 isoform X2 [Amborella trichopoda]
MAETLSNMEEETLTVFDGDKAPLSPEDIPNVERGESNYEEAEEAMEAPVSLHCVMKLKELLRNICSVDSRSVRSSSKEFIRLLRGDSGGQLLHKYVRASPLCTELSEAWKLRSEKKTGLSYVLSLISVIFELPHGKRVLYFGEFDAEAKAKHSVSKRLDTFARLLLETRMEDVYSEINSKEIKRQNAALLLMASIVRRGIGLASEVAKRFDFSMKIFPKLAENRPRKDREKNRKVGSTRAAFIQFAMSFLEVGSPKLLRWILQKKDMYSGVLRGLACDSERTIVNVLSVLQARVLCKDSLVPPGLQSVLFGDVTLGQMSLISGNLDAKSAAEMAHETLLMVCTDPSHGLMPDLSEKWGTMGLSENSKLKGNPARLLRLMLKLRPTEVGYHRDLLLAIVQGRPLLGSSYMDSFPYNLEPRESPTWFSAVSLASDLIFAAKSILPFASLAKRGFNPPSMESTEIKSVLKCIVPRSFTRVVINRGLLHSDIYIKHASLRLLLEALKSLNNLVDAISDALECMSVEPPEAHAGSIDLRQLMPGNKLGSIEGLSGIDALSNTSKCLHTDLVVNGCTQKSIKHKWLSLKQEVQIELRSVLPDPQVLLKLLSIPKCYTVKNDETWRKRERYSDSCGNRTKRPKQDAIDEDIDICVNRLNGDWAASNFGDGETVNVESVAEELVSEEDPLKPMAEVWGLSDSSGICEELKDTNVYFQSKLLDALTLYLRVMPTSLTDGSFDFFKLLPSNPWNLPICEQRSLVSLLLEAIAWSSGSRVPAAAPMLMYKHLQPLIKWMLYSPVNDISSQAHVLVQAAILSTGAFGNNFLEIEAWLLFLPGYKKDNVSMGISNEAFCKFTAPIISFFCDTISTMGNNVYKHLNQLRCLLSKFDSAKDVSPDFSPLVICILQKCLRVLESGSKTLKVTGRTMISMYVGNSLCFLLQTQVQPASLAAIITSLLASKVVGSCQPNVDSGNFHCEWRPMENLLLFSKRVLDEEASCHLLSTPLSGDNQSFLKALGQAKKIIRNGHDGWLSGVALALTSAILCAAPVDMLADFPSLIIIAEHIYGVDTSVLSSILCQERVLLSQVAHLWPDLFMSSLDVVSCACKEAAPVSGYNASHSPVSGLPGLGIDFDSKELAIATFGIFLQHIPFNVLFSAITSFNDTDLLGSTKMRGVLQAKLLESPADSLIASVHLILFWMYRISRKEVDSSIRSWGEQLTTCFALVEHILIRILSSASVLDSSQEIKSTTAAVVLIQEVVEAIFCHPAVALLLLHPLINHGEPENGGFNNLEAFLCSSSNYVHPVDHHVLHLLNVVADYLSTQMTVQGLNLKLRDVHGSVLKACQPLLRRPLSVFRDEVLAGMTTHKELFPCLPSFYVLWSLKHFLSPFELLELVYWLFCNIDEEKIKDSAPSMPSAIYLGLHIAEEAFSMLSSFVLRGKTKVALWNIFGEVAGTFDLDVFEKIYDKILNFSLMCNLEIADLCLLRVMLVSVWNCTQSSAVLLPLSMTVQKMISCCPMDLLIHCIYKTNRIKSRILFLITQISPLHLSIFGEMFLSVLGNDSSREVPKLDGAYPVNVITEETTNHCFTSEEYILLLPVALKYFFSEFAESSKQKFVYAECIPVHYSKTLLQGFSNWQDFVSSKIFWEEGDDVVLTSPEEFHNFFSSTILSRTIGMLELWLIMKGKTLRKKKRIKLFDSIDRTLHCRGVLVDSALDELCSSSFEQSLNTVNRITARIYFLRMLLFPQNSILVQKFVEINDGTGEMSTERKQNGSDNLKLGQDAYFEVMSILSITLDKLVQKFPLNLYNLESTMVDSSQLVRFLEMTILTNLVELAREIGRTSADMHPVPFLGPFLRSSLLHRFEDPSTLKALRSILLSLPEGNLAFGDAFEYLVAHSQFVPAILWSEAGSDRASVLSHSGMLFRPFSSILHLLSYPNSVQSVSEMKSNLKTSSGKREISFLSYQRKLELVKLLRVLYHLKVRQGQINTTENSSTNAKELLSLLLAGYGATLSVIDVEMLSLMHEIESLELTCHGCLSEMDYLWGTSALTIRRERALEGSLASTITDDCETAEEKRKREFRENLPVDSRVCAWTVLHFSYDREIWTQSEPLEKLKEDNLMDLPIVIPSRHGEMVAQYDPAFVLRFAIHSLSMGFIEPMEFSGLGLLAVAFISMSSSDEGIRKLAYDALGRFKTALENCWNCRNGPQLRLLLTYIQNGIKEPWQQIPSVIAIFAAEASFILMDPANGLYVNVNQFLMRSPRVDLEAVPLFHSLFGSCSIHFLSDRKWILHLLFAGLNLVDDAQIFKRKFLFELLLSFYNSSLADHNTRVLILQIVRKAVKLHMMGRYLVEQSGLISWLSSIILFGIERLHGEIRELVLTQMVIALEEKGKLVNFIIWAISIALVSDCPPVYLLGHFNQVGAIVPEENQSEIPLIAKLLRWVTASVILGWVSKARNSQDGFFPMEVSRPQTLLSLLEEVPHKGAGSENSTDNALARLILYLQQLLGVNYKFFPSVVSALSILLSADLHRSCDPNSGNVMFTRVFKMLASKISCPVEANPAWRWSYYQSWRDLSSVSAESEMISENHACQALRFFFLEVSEKLSSSRLSLLDAGKFGIFVDGVREILINAPGKS